MEHVEWLCGMTALLVLFHRDVESQESHGLVCPLHETRMCYASNSQRPPYTHVLIHGKEFARIQEIHTLARALCLRGSRSTMVTSTTPHPRTPPREASNKRKQAWDTFGVEPGDEVRRAVQ